VQPPKAGRQFKRVFQIAWCACVRLCFLAKIVGMSNMCVSVASEAH